MRAASLVYLPNYNDVNSSQPLLYTNVKNFPVLTNHDRQEPNNCALPEGKEEEEAAAVVVGALPVDVDAITEADST